MRISRWTSRRPPLIGSAINSLIELVPQSIAATLLIARLPLAPVLAALRSSLALAFGAHCSAPSRSGPRCAAILTRARLRASRRPHLSVQDPPHARFGGQRRQRFV